MNQQTATAKTKVQKTILANLFIQDVPMTNTNNDQQYITRRVIDACLRENVRNITKYGEVINLKVIENLLIDWSYSKPEQWLSISHLGDFVIYLPIEQNHFIQPWKTAIPAWLIVSNNQVLHAEHYQDWLSLLSHDLTVEQQSFYQTYSKECDCAVKHRAFATEIYQRNQEKLNQDIFSSQTHSLDSWQQLSLTEQLGAHLDHPLYPTARAKFGLEKKSINDYCPEAMAEFSLNWLAVPKNLYNSSVQAQPKQWPTFENVGLPASLAESHQLIPIHPLTFQQYIVNTLNDWLHKDTIYYAPLSYLTVRPTLSVRTMLIIDEPNIHIKLPLPMHTLGSKNIRTIKPSTITDGYVFQQILQYIAKNDPHLTKHYLHSHEQQGGHVDERADLAWLLREYPKEVSSSSPVCVAAFTAKNPAGILVIEQLAQHYYQSDLSALLNDYFSLLLKVHLRLWLVYGITLEANQQNCLVLFHANKPLQLLFRDNDSGRIYAKRLLDKCPALQNQLARFIDQRLLVDDEKSLLQMFTTIMVQLNMTCLINALVTDNLADENKLYALLIKVFTQELEQLTAQGVDTSYAQKNVIEAPLHYAKYLLTAGSLLSKQDSGAASINKFYGLSALNPLMNKAMSETGNE